MDPPAGLNPAGDTTLFLALEAQSRGHELHWFHPSSLAAHNGRILANCHPLQVFDTLVDFHRQGDAKVSNLEEFDIILIRQDPPYDMAYLTACWLLERLSHPRVLNNPASLRNRPEKIFPLTFPHYCPATCISADPAALRAFRQQQGAIILKPLYGFGGHGVLLIKKDDANFETFLESHFLHSAEPLVAQAFLPDVATEEKRIILINGEVKAAFSRLPAEGTIRSNLRIGGTAAATQLTPIQHQIANEVGTICQAEGLLLVGLDVIGDHLIEINTTSPTGLRAAQKLFGLNLAADFWDAVESSGQ